MDKDDLALITVPCPHDACLTMVVYHKLNELAPITVPCPHDGCLTVVAYHEIDDHKTACPYIPCGCMEVGCIFTASPVKLLIHLESDHKVQVHRISYAQPMEFTVTMSLPSFLPSMVIVYYDDANVFILIIGELGQAGSISSVCIREDACSRPRYRVKLRVTGPFSPADFSMNTVNGAMEPTSCASPRSIILEDLTFLIVHPWYIIAATGQYQKVFSFSICNDKKNLS